MAQKDGLFDDALMYKSCWLPTYKYKMSPQHGHGSAIGHHGEILQGVFEDSLGHLRRGLVTLPCNIFRSECTFAPDTSGMITLNPVGRHKARQAVELTLVCCDLVGWGGKLTLDSNIPQRWGLGSSTCDITASIRAIGSAFHLELSPTLIADIAVKAEKASDSVMFGSHAVLFAHRDGIVIEDFGNHLPSLEVVGFNTDQTGKGIDTLNFPPAHYSWWEIEAFRPLVGLLRRAIYTQDPQLVGKVALASARINQRYLPKPQFDRLERLVETTGAIGLQVAHSGTIVGILFDPRESNKEEKIQHTQVLIAEMGFGATWHFQTSDVQQVRHLADELPR